MEFPKYWDAADDCSTVVLLQQRLHYLFRESLFDSDNCWFFCPGLCFTREPSRSRAYNQWHRSVVTCHDGHVDEYNLQYIPWICNTDWCPNVYMIVVIGQLLLWSSYKSDIQHSWAKFPIAAGTAAISIVGGKRLGRLIVMVAGSGCCLVKFRTGTCFTCNWCTMRLIIYSILSWDAQPQVAVGHRKTMWIRWTAQKWT